MSCVYVSLSLVASDDRVSSERERLCRRPNSKGEIIDTM